ncbi:O-antigen ligase family protein [Clostridium perfringens]|uniref:O-antigen ligase family protein n=2 Tax=Clostridium perfringens TaxID=1502 RepID=UPI0030CFFE86
MKKYWNSELIINIQSIIAFFMLMFYISIYPINFLLAKFINVEIFSITKLLFVFIVLYFMFNIKYKNFYINKNNFISIIVFLFILIIVIKSLFNSDSFTLYKISNKYMTMYDYHIYFLGSVLVPILSMIIVGNEYKKICGFKNNNLIKNIVIALYFIEIILIIYVKLRYYNISGQALLEESGKHLFLGDSFVVLTFIILNLIKNNINKNLIVLISLITLYLIGSRSAFFLFIILVIVKFIFEKLTRKKCIEIGSILIIISIISCYILIPVYQGKKSNLINNRVFTLVFNTDDDHSLNSREELNEVGIRVIKENPLLGNLFYEIEEYKITGRYIHNVLGYWAEFGFFVFIIIFINILIKLIKALKNYLRGKDTSYINSLIIIFCLSALFSRSYNNAFIWLALTLNYSIGEVEK